MGPDVFAASDAARGQGNNEDLIASWEKASRRGSG
jgi:hypothetical protein